MKRAKVMGFVALLFVFPFVSLSRSSENGQDRKVALEARWKREREEVVNGWVKARAFRGGTIAPLSVEEVTKLIRSADLQADPAAMKKVVMTLSNGTVKVDPPWSIVDIYFEGTKVKEVKSGQYRHEILRDGTNETQYSGASRTASLHSKLSNEYVRGLRDYRFTPAKQISQLKPMGAGATEVDVDGYRVVVDDRLGDIREVYLNHASGKLRMFSLYEKYVDCPGGVRIPGVVFEGNVDGAGKLEYCSLSVLEEATFNTELPVNAFRIATDDGTNVIDLRKNRPSSYLKEPAIQDIVTFANTGGRNKGETPIPIAQVSRTRYYVIGAIAAGIIAAGLYLAWRRWFHRTHADPHPA